MAVPTFGIPARVDTRRAILTEHILVETGVSRPVAGVGPGTTRPEGLEPERARDVAITSAVVSPHPNKLTVGLNATRSRVDIVAEVARSLRVLDGLALVIASAIDGIRAPTRRVAGALCAAGFRLLLFLSKVDRLGAHAEARRFLCTVFGR